LDAPTPLASAYLDGEATPDERARVEADPTLLADVDRLRAVSRLLQDTEPAPISVREQHLAAALSAWDRLPDAERLGSDRAALTTSLDERRRARANRWLLGAAAALVMVLAGGLVLQTAHRDDTDDSFASEASAEVRSASTTAAAAESGPAPQPQAATAAEPQDGSSTALPDGAESPETGSVATGSLDAAPPGELGLERLATPEQLAIFAGDAVAAPTVPEVPDVTSTPVDDDTSVAATPWPICLGVDVVVGPAEYDGVTVVVGIDESRSLAIAYEPTTCREVARAGLP
jgi:hypothetical protein